MTFSDDTPTVRRSPAEWAALLLRLRDAYDALPSGGRADLKTPNADVLRTEGAAWSLLTRVYRSELDAGTMTERDLGLLIVPLWLFPLAAHDPHDADAFRFGAWLRNVYPGTRGENLLRQLLGARTPKALLRHTADALGGAGRRSAVAWGALGAHLVFWQFAGRPRTIVLEQWASAFYRAQPPSTPGVIPHDD